MIYRIDVAVALSRPPRVHEWRRYMVVGRSPQDAQLIALQMACCTSTMPVYADRPVEVKHG